MSNIPNGLDSSFLGAYARVPTSSGTALLEAVALLNWQQIYFGRQMPANGSDIIPVGGRWRALVSAACGQEKLS